MASDTQDRVFQAADELLKEGRRPTQQNIRERIGQGSLTTINKALNRWWSELGARLQGNRRLPEVPEPVEHAAQELWRLALAHAEHDAERIRRELEAGLAGERADLAREREQQQALLAASQEKLERAYGRIDSLQSQLDDLRARLQEGDQEALARGRQALDAERERRALVNENQKLTEALAVAEVEIKSLSQKNKELASQPEAQDDLFKSPRWQALETENRNLKRALEQADSRFAEQADVLNRLRDEVGSR